MQHSCIKVLALIEATSVTGPAKNLLDFATRARDKNYTGARPIETEIVTFQRVRPGHLSIRRAPSSTTDIQASTLIGRAQDLGITTQVIRERFRFDTGCLKQLRDCVDRSRPDLIQTHSVK